MAKKKKLPLEEVEILKDRTRLSEFELLEYLRKHCPHDSRLPELEEKFK